MFRPYDADTITQCVIDRFIQQNGRNVPGPGYFGFGYTLYISKRGTNTVPYILGMWHEQETYHQVHRCEPTERIDLRRTRLIPRTRHGQVFEVCMSAVSDRSTTFCHPVETVQSSSTLIADWTPLSQDPRQDDHYCENKKCHNIALYAFSIYKSNEGNTFVI